MMNMLISVNHELEQFTPLTADLSVFLNVSKHSQWDNVAGQLISYFPVNYILDDAA